MFSNILADYLGLYRMGFSDILAVIFNDMLNYVTTNVETIQGSVPLNVKPHHANITLSEDNGGILWGPELDSILHKYSN